MGFETSTLSLTLKSTFKKLIAEKYIKIICITYFCERSVIYAVLDLESPSVRTTILQILIETNF